MHFLLILGLLGGWTAGERHPLVPADAAIRTRWSGATSGTNGWIDRANVVCARTLCRRLIIKGVEKLKDLSYNIIPDRIEAGTLLCAKEIIGRNDLVGC